MRPLWVVLACLALAASGCTSQKAPAAPGATGTVPSPGSLPFGTGTAPHGCDPTRPAVVHGPGAAAWTGNPGIPCLVVSPFRTGETSMGVTKDGSIFVYPAEESPLSSAVESGVGQFTGLGIARSEDGGMTWSLQEDKVGGVANYHEYTADPFMYVDPYTDRVFMEDLMVPPFNCANLSFSDDRGDTWTQSVAGCMIWDHVSYAAGPSILKDTNGYPTVLQRCGITYIMTTVISEGTGCQKSLDGGKTWQPPGQPAFLFGADGMPYAPTTCNGAAHHAFVDYRGWTWVPRGWCDGNPWVAVSKDEGATWERHMISGKGVAGHDVGIGVDPAGNAYAFWAGKDNLPYLAVSKDEGKTWSDPIPLDVPGLKAMGSIALSPGGIGKVGLSYGANLVVDKGAGVHGMLTYVYDLDTDHPTFVTAEASDPKAPLRATGTCADGFCTGETDFITGRMGPEGAAYSSFNDQTLASAAHIYGATSLWDASDPNGPYP
jgi:hypothetical protein